MIAQQFPINLETLFYPFCGLLLLVMVFGIHSTHARRIKHLGPIDKANLGLLVASLASLAIAALFYFFVPLGILLVLGFVAWKFADYKIDSETVTVDETNWNKKYIWKLELVRLAAWIWMCTGFVDLLAKILRT